MGRTVPGSDPVGRIGDLIYAASVFDIYFAMNAGERFGSRDETRSGAHRYAGLDGRHRGVGPNVAASARHEIRAGGDCGCARLTAGQL